MRKKLASAMTSQAKRNRIAFWAQTIADAMGLGRSPAGSLAVPLHFGYLSGDGPSRFTIDIDFADHPQAHRFQYLRIDLDHDLGALLDGTAFETWKEDKRVGG
ncbi:MAG: hypothetical protein HYT80_11895 [Euryarchaeota archaeon]|nr:hypothetical protein [Euryarchaeota archaeon]